MNRANECRELLLDAGSDPLAEFGKPGETGNFLERLAWGSMNGVSSRYDSLVTTRRQGKTKRALDEMMTNQPRAAQDLQGEPFLRV